MIYSVELNGYHSECFLIKDDFNFKLFGMVTNLTNYLFIQDRGEPVPPEDSLDVARRVKEMYCYTCADIVKV